MSDIHERFGQLRSMMQAPMSKRDASNLWSLMEWAALTAPDVYVNEWVPYMRGFPEHFDRPLHTTWSCAIIEQLARTHPHAMFCLAGHDPDATSLEATVGMTFMRQVVSLVLRDLSLGADAARALASSENLSGLKKLDLGCNDVGGAGAASLANSKHLGRLTYLDLSENQLGDVGTKALAESEHLVGLRKLDLTKNAIGDEGARALANSPNLGGLVALRLSGNPIGAEGAAALANSPHLPEPIRSWWRR